MARRKVKALAAEVVPVAKPKTFAESLGRQPTPGCSMCIDAISPPTNGAPEHCEACEKDLDEGRWVNIGVKKPWEPKP